MDRPASAPLDKNERRDRLRLIRSENVGPVTFYQFLRHFGSAGAALEALPELARRGGRKANIRVCGTAEAEDEIAALDGFGARLVLWGEDDYPRPLAAVEDAPPAIAVIGNVSLLAQPTIAIVGARNASANGRRFARQIADELSKAGLVVASGMARGIDAEAHTGSLASGTVAVVAGGVDVIYPDENAELYARIAAEGTVISEQKPGTVPTARHFPRRNRIISGLALGVLVVEAAPRSGSLITARLALEQGREVLAVPGSPLDPRARGTNNLIRQGAVLVESAEDVLRAIGGMTETALADDTDNTFTTAKTEAPGENQVAAVREEITSALAPTPVPIDELARQTGARPSLVAAVLLELELAGKLQRHPGNQVSLVAGRPVAS